MRSSRYESVAVSVPARFSINGKVNGYKHKVIRSHRWIFVVLHVSRGQ